MHDSIALPHGFLPEKDPLQTLPQPFDPWEEVAKNLPKLLVSNQFRKVISELPPFPTGALNGIQELERAMQILSYLGHAYVGGDKASVPQSLPAILSVPWYEVAKQLGRPPVPSYASYSLYNWKRLDPQGP